MGERCLDRREFLQAAGTTAVLGLCARVGLGKQRKLRRKPSFVFFLVDDLGWKDLGCYGSTFYETPNIDRLAAQGMRFTNAYAACPVCSPTRASIMTGKYPARLATTDYFGAPQPDTVQKHWTKDKSLLPARYENRVPLEEVTVAEALKGHGYATFFAGKWHLGPEGFWPEDQGFDINKGGIERGGPYGGNKYFSPYGNPRLPDGPAGEHLPDRLATETCKFIEASKDRPFLAYLAFYSVHTPLMARDDLKAKYDQKAKQVKHNGPDWGTEGDRQVRLVQDHAVYAGMVEAMDQAVGKVLDTLDRLDLSEDTVVFFMSDNGGLSTSEGHPTSNLPLRAGKGWLYEGGIREPMIVRWPGKVQAGSVCDEPVISTDFYPTMLEMAGLPLKPEQHVDGRSMVSLLKQQGRQEDRAFFWHYPHYGNQGGSPGGAVRVGDCKLIEFYEDDRVELYNLRDDLGERNDLAAKMPDKATELRQMLHRWRSEVGARMPTVNPNRE
ncbi:MAG TPA: sulfatase [Sedimentisphaerales bacterium]|jgi:arylsulfatase A-like enzyme|nr:sulfatase [Sedimentisphaerales bacterium]HNU30726.1 sulfatase [Sedimentisphaerales bacterium]